MSSAERFGFDCESTGIVEIECGVIHKDFGIHGVNLQPNDDINSKNLAY